MRRRTHLCYPRLHLSRRIGGIIEQRDILLEHFLIGLPLRCLRHDGERHQLVEDGRSVSVVKLFWSLSAVMKVVFT